MRSGLAFAAAFCGSFFPLSFSAAGSFASPSAAGFLRRRPPRLPRRRFGRVAVPPSEAEAESVFVSEPASAGSGVTWVGAAGAVSAVRSSSPGLRRRNHGSGKENLLLSCAHGGGTRECGARRALHDAKGSA